MSDAAIATSADLSSPVPAHPVPRRRRWWLRVPLTLLALLAVIVVLVQAFLLTDYPRRIAQTQVERILHVRARIRSVSIGWLGHTRIEGVELTLPMEREPFLRVNRIDATHASLPVIAFAQNLSDVAVSGVEVIARQTSDGKWNLPQLVPAGLTRSTAEPSTSTNVLENLPSLHATDVRTSLIRADGRRLDLPIVAVELQKRDALIAEVKLTAGSTLDVSGELGLDAAMRQSLEAHFAGVPADIAAFFGVAIPQTTVSANWTGRLTAGGVVGTLVLNDMQVDSVRTRGRVELATAGTQITLRPADLALTITAGGPLDAHATAGLITVERFIKIEGLQGTLNGGRFSADGTLDPATLVSAMSAEWQGIARNTLVTTGSAKLSTSRTFTADIQLDITATGAVIIPSGNAAGAVTFSGKGPGIAAFAGHVVIDPLTWTPANSGRPIIMPRLTGHLSSVGTDISFDARNDADAAQGTLIATGGFDRAKNSWWATFDAAALRLPEIEARGVKGAIDVSAIAAGTLVRVDVSRAYAKIGALSAYAVGSYQSAPTDDLKLTAWTWYDKPVSEDQATQFNDLSATASATGTLVPRNLKADVNVDGKALVFEGRDIGDVSLELAAVIGADDATVVTREMEAFGGRWSLSGHWPEIDHGPPTIVARFRDVPAANLGALLKRDDLTGMIERGMATLRPRSTRLDALDMVASAHGSNLSAGRLHADTLDLSATLKAGKFEIKPVLHEGTGTFEAGVQGELAAAIPLRASVTLTDWPAPYVVSTAAGAQRFRPRASGTLHAQASLQTGDLEADIALGGTIERGESKLADFRVEGGLKNRLITVERATLDTLDGTLAATGRLDVDHVNATVIDATFTHLTPARLSWFSPIAEEVQGRLSGTFAIHPCTTPRALGPLEITLTVTPEDAMFRGVQIGDLSVVAYGEVKDAHNFRFVSDNATFNIAGGQIAPFVRISNEANRGFAQLITADFHDLDLVQLTKAIKNDGEALVGKIAGRAQIYGSTTSLATLSGDATLNITDSDLANFGPIAALYNALSIGREGSQPDGSGAVSLRFGGDEVVIDDANYFNRGVYASAFGPVRQLSKGTDATVDRALVVGSLQPLRAVKLPFFGDLNDTLAALQSSLTAIEVTGTIKDPHMREVSLRAIGDTFQKLLLGKAREKN